MTRSHMLLPVMLVCTMISCAACNSPRSNAHDQIITTAQARIAALDEHTVIRGSLAMQEGVQMPYAFSISSKGNGALSIGNLFLKIYDAHADDELYSPMLLGVTPLRDSDGLCSGLEIQGTKILLDEATGSELRREHIAVRCDFDPVMLRFHTTGDRDNEVVLFE